MCDIIILIDFNQLSQKNNDSKIMIIFLSIHSVYASAPRPSKIKPLCLSQSKTKQARVKNHGLKYNFIHFLN